MNTQRTLSQKDRLVLQSYESVLEGLAEFFGSSFEFVLHSLEDLDCAAIKVVNGYHSGRKEGAPITDFALQLLGEMQRSKDHRKGRIYFGRSKSGTPIRSATIPINGENGQIIGLLCINFYQDVPLYTLIEELFQTSGTKGDVLETFAANADELIEESISQARIQVEHDGTIPSTNRNKMCIRDRSLSVKRPSSSIYPFSSWEMGRSSRYRRSLKGFSILEKTASSWPFISSGIRPASSQDASFCT